MLVFFHSTYLSRRVILMFCFSDTTDFIRQMVSGSPEACYTYLADLEKTNDPRTDAAFLSRLLDCYSKVFTRFPLSQYSKLESYARMLVRYAELKG